MDQRAWRAVIPDEAAEAGGALAGRTGAGMGLGREHGRQQRGPGCVRTDESRGPTRAGLPLWDPGPKAPGRCPRQLRARLSFLGFPSGSSLLALSGRRAGRGGRPGSAGLRVHCPSGSLFLHLWKGTSNAASSWPVPVYERW